MQDDTYGGPLLVPTIDAGTKGLQTLDIARAVSDAGFPLDSALSFVRNCTVKGLLHPYGRTKSDNRKNYLFRADQAVIVGVLRRMSEAGISDPAARLAMSNTLGMWHVDDMEGRDVPRSPAMAMLKAHLLGQTGYFAELATYMDPQNGKFQFAARVRQEPTGSGTNPTLWNDRMELRATWFVAMTPLLTHLTRGLEPVQ